MVRQQRPGIRATNPRWVKAAGGAARLVLLLAALTLAASCRSSSPPDVPTPAEPTGSPPAPADQPANLPQPVLAVPGDAYGYGPGALYLPRAGDGPQEVTLWFGAPLAADAPEQVRVDPREALVALTPAGGNDLDRMPEGLRLFLLPPGDDIPVTITVDAALSAEDGRRLGQPASFEIRFALPTVARLALGGSTWLPATGEQRFTEEDTAVRLPVLRAGTAVLEAEFSRPVDQEAVVAALQRQLPAEIRTGVPSWSGDGTHLQLPLYQNVTRSLEVRLSLAPGPARGSARDGLNMPLSASETGLAWTVAAPAAVVAAGGDGNPSAGAGPAGQMPQLPLLDPAGPHALRGGRLLAWHRDAGTGDCPARSLTLWEPAAGAGITLAGGVHGCLAWAAWTGDDTAVLVGPDGAVLYRIPPALPLSGMLDGPQVSDFWKPSTGVVVGAALAPGAPAALFHAPAAAAPGSSNSGGPGTAGLPGGTAADLGGSASVDLVLISGTGQVLRRIPNVSDLASQEPSWRPLQAVWSPDGRWLGFVTYRAGQERDPAGYPAPVRGHLAILDAATGSLAEHDLEPLALTWQPRAGVLWVRARDGWQVVDPASGSVRPVGAGLHWPLAFDPGGRYLLGLGPDGPAVFDAATATLTGVAGFRPLGWDPVDGRAYWLEH